MPIDVILFLFTALVLSGPGDTRVPDKVDLTDGTKLEGRVVYEDELEVILRVGSKDRALKKGNVQRVTSRATAQRQVIERWIALSESDPRGLLDLAAYCKSNDLLEEMRLLAMELLLFDPNQATAHEYLGHEKTHFGWLVRDGARKIEWSKFLLSHTEFNDAWELESTHYKVRTNLPLRDALATTFDLECHYYAFRKLFASDLHLLEVVEPLYAAVHADAKSFPELADRRIAYFVPGTRTLIVNAIRGLEVSVLMHEATHALLFANAYGLRSASSDVPAWLSEGLAEFVAAGMQGDAGQLKFAKDALYREHFRTFAEAKSPYDLSRLLNFDATDFLTSSRSDLKYAESYTLVHFLTYGGGGKYRPSFLQFVASCYRGQASQTHFKDALGRTEAELQREWRAYVKTLVGS